MASENAINKLMTTTSLKYYEYVNIMIKNGLPFAIETYDISINNNDESIFPTMEKIVMYLHKLFNEVLKYRKLPQKALDNMKAKGITPKKQAIEQLLVFITFDANNVYYAISIPKKLSNITSNEGINKLMETFNNYAIETDNVNTEFETIQIYGKVVDEFPLKHRDVIKQHFINKMSEFGLYTAEDSDDDGEYNLNDF